MMKNRKALKFLLCFVAVLAMTFGVLAAAADKAAGDAEAPAEETAAAAPADAAEEEQPEAPAEEEQPEAPAEEVAAPAEEPAAEPEVSAPAEPEAQQSAAPAAGQEISFFDQLMACNSLEDLWAMLDGASEEVLAALSAEQNQQLDAHITALEPEPAPAIVIEESEAPVESEVEYAMVSYTNVAPFGDPIVGQHQ